MKIILLSLLGILLFQAPSHAQRGKFFQKMAEKRLDNKATENTGPLPDYSQLYYWAASPYKHDDADSIPAFLPNEKRDSSADVFFIHPTTYTGDINTASWNADLTKELLNKDTDARPILYQASVFNASCRVFAPRYRQAHLKAFFVRNSLAAQEAFNVAYGDIKKAFQYYIEHDNHGRPIVIASHSQGSLHAIRLLQEFFDGKPLQKQLVCAYIVGYQIEENTFKNIPIGNSPTAIGCFVGWRSYQKNEMPPLIIRENGHSVCVNPLTWTTSTQEASSELNLGTLKFFNSMTPKAVGAGIEPASKILWVTLPKDMPEKIQQLKNLHVYDYNLFWMNIRENVKERVAAFIGK